MIDLYRTEENFDRQTELLNNIYKHIIEILQRNFWKLASLYQLLNKMVLKFLCPRRMKKVLSEKLRTVKPKNQHRQIPCSL